MFWVSEDFAWRIEPGTDLVLQVHLRPSGKPEPVQLEVGLYFTDKPPPRQPFNLLLRSTTIDLPPGRLSDPIEARYTLPALATTVVQRGEVVAAGAVGTRRAGTA